MVIQYNRSKHIYIGHVISVVLRIIKKLAMRANVHQTIPSQNLSLFLDQLLLVAIKYLLALWKDANPQYKIVIQSNQYDIKGLRYLSVY